MQTAAIILSVAALGGLAVASYPLRGLGRPPTWLALLHGLIAATGLVVLIQCWADGSLPGSAMTALWVLVFAALGGATLFLGFHVRGKPLPKLLVVMHAAIALAGLGMLWSHVPRT